MLETLTKRELETLSLVAKGLSNKEIAEILCIGDTTTRDHLLHIYQKLNLEKCYKYQASVLRVNAVLIYLEEKGLLKELENER